MIYELILVGKCMYFAQLWSLCEFARLEDHNAPETWDAGRNHASLDAGIILLPLAAQCRTLHATEALLH